MSEARIITGTMGGRLPSTRALHLVLDLDLILEDLKHEDDGIRRLENVRSCLPVVEVTCFTDLGVSDAVARLAAAGTCPLDHLLAEAGRVLHHRNAVGVLEPDHDYLEWLDFQSGTQAHPGAAKAIGVEYLEMNWDAPRPLMVVGRSDADAPILGLADIPILSERERRKGGCSGFLTYRAFRLEAPGLSGVVRLLLAYLSTGPHSAPNGHIRAMPGSEPARWDASRTGSKARLVQPGLWDRRKGTGEERRIARPLQGP